MPKGVAKDAGGDSDKDALDVKDLRELVKAFENFKRDYRSDMRELKDSVSFCTDICNDVKGIAENIKQLRQEMHDIVNENKALKAENERLAQKCEELEQYQRLNNVEVKGVPVGDDPVLAMKKIGETVGEAIDEADLDTFEFCMCDISARMHCLAERRSKIGQTGTGKYANAMRVSNSIAAATARPTFFRFISFETRVPNLRQTVPKGDAASVRVVRSTPRKQRSNAPVAVASVSTVRD
ncbi:hypothetical protein HPB50_004781 [Hyalomma asiaticum]|uniref:Uncharacterized protein n=1 Tax=Hyalomma asiaticum TaxID=266040 RepID=A0ACB7SQ14_HYAAI|nr:hypothetical protein HPB50_004781 [Hyalomma asiaticum]